MATSTDTGAVDAAIIAALRADTALMAICSGGVYYGAAAPGTDAVVIVDRFDHVADDNLFGGQPAGESYTYLVKAVLPDSTGTDVARQAAARIRAVLDAPGAALLANGYGQQAPSLETKGIRYVEVDPANPDRRVQHWGGHYELQLQRLS